VGADGVINHRPQFTQERDDDLVVATHGRGIYILDIAPLSGLTPAVLAADAHLFEPEPEVRWVAADRTSYASSNFEGESEDPGASIFYFLRDQAADSATVTVYQCALPVAEIKGPAEAGIHRVQWDMQKRVERTEAEQERLRAEAGRGGGGGGGGRGRGGASEEDRIRYAISDAAPGVYRVVLSAGGTTLESTVTVLRDEWWRERR
jgi:hypothetical protein